MVNPNTTPSWLVNALFDPAKGTRLFHFDTDMRLGPHLNTDIKFLKDTAVNHLQLQPVFDKFEQVATTLKSIGPSILGTSKAILDTVKTGGQAIIDAVSRSPIFIIPNPCLWDRSPYTQLSCGENDEL